MIGWCKDDMKSFHLSREMPRSGTNGERKLKKQLANRGLCVYIYTFLEFVKHIFSLQQMDSSVNGLFVQKYKVI